LKQSSHFETTFVALNWIFGAAPFVDALLKLSGDFARLLEPLARIEFVTVNITYQSGNVKSNFGH